MASRYTTIDIAKGIGILSIVLGHNHVLVHRNGELFNVLFSFHVPLFFFLSGLFINPDYQLQRHAIKRLDSYLKPYFVTFVFLGAAIVPFETIAAIKYSAKILYGTGPGFPWGWVQLWFLPHLFAVSVFSYLCFVKTNLMSKPSLFKAAFLLSMFSMGAIGIDRFWNIPVSGSTIILPGLPFSIDLILLSSSYFLLGGVLKQEVLNFELNWRLFVLAAAIFAFIHFRFNYTVDFNMRRYDNIMVCAIASLIGIYIIISVSKMLQETPILSRVLSYIGSASLFILLFHNYIQLKTIILLKAAFTGNTSISIPAIAFASFAMAVIVPISLYELAKRHTALGMLFLPIKNWDRLFFDNMKDGIDQTKNQPPR